MLGYEILSLKESGRWQDFFNKLPPAQRDVYFLPEYYSIHEYMGEGKAFCFVYYENGDISLYPFLMNSVNELGFSLDHQYVDIQGAYGYNGVATTSCTDSFKNSFFSAIKDYAEENSIIAEFTRFNPVLKNSMFSEYLNPQFNQKNVIVDLRTNDIEKDCYEYTTRKNIKKAIRSNLSCSRYRAVDMGESQLKEFMRIYYATMRRSGAEETYYFPGFFFQEIIKLLSGNSLFYFVRYNNTLVSAELVMLGESIGYSFLGGTLKEFFEFRPNDFLKDYIIKDLKKNNLEYFCLGGGSEGILRYKRKFNKNGEVDFHIGKKVHNKEIYNEVIRQWERMNPEKLSRYKNYFLRYRC